MRTIRFTFDGPVYKRTSMIQLTRLLIVAIVLMLAACASGPRSDEPPRINPQAQAIEAYRIGADDVIRVAVWQNPDLNVTVPVRPDGRISVPLVGALADGRG